MTFFVNISDVDSSLDDGEPDFDAIFDIERELRNEKPQPHSHASVVLSMWERIPVEMQMSDHWLLWRKSTDATTGKTKKLPVDEKGNFVNPTQGHSSFEVVTNTLDSALENKNKSQISGIGFSIVPPFVAIDFDHVLDEDENIIDPEIEAIVCELNSYTEVSPSGTGLHVFVMTDAADLKSGRSDVGEIYFNNRFMTVTGNIWQGCMNTHINHIDAASMRSFRDRIVPPKVEKVKTVKTSIEHASFKQTNHLPELCEDDATIISKIKASSFGSALFRGDISLYDDDHSRADLALCGRIAKFTSSAKQIDRIFRESGLYRPKWDTMRGETTYGWNTISIALHGAYGGV